MKDKINMQDIESNILDTEIVKHVTKGGKVLRWAVLTTESGFAVVGKPSATVNELNDNQEIGEKVAIDNSKSEMWALMGYELAQKRHHITDLNTSKITELGKGVLLFDVAPIIYEQLKQKDSIKLGELTITKNIELKNKVDANGKEVDMSNVLGISWKITIFGEKYCSWTTYNKNCSEKDFKYVIEVLLLQLHYTIEKVVGIRK